MLHTLTRVVTFIILAFSVYLFFAGHNNPGGGFIGGLMTACALLLMYLGFDMKSMKKALPFNFTSMIAIGLLIAIATGVSSSLLAVDVDKLNIPRERRAASAANKSFAFRCVIGCQDRQTLRVSAMGKTSLAARPAVLLQLLQFLALAAGEDQPDRHFRKRQLFTQLIEQISLVIAAEEFRLVHDHDDGGGIHLNLADVEQFGLRPELG
jgi:hypothetical protein